MLLTNERSPEASRSAVCICGSIHHGRAKLFASSNKSSKLTTQKPSGVEHNLSWLVAPAAVVIHLAQAHSKAQPEDDTLHNKTSNVLALARSLFQMLQWARNERWSFLTYHLSTMKRVPIPWARLLPISIQGLNVGESDRPICATRSSHVFAPEIKHGGRLFAVPCLHIVR